MASGAGALYELQKIDAQTDEMMEALSQVASQTDQDEDLLSARQNLAEAEESLRKARGKLRSLELDLDEISSKIASAQDMLYGGSVSNPKELAGFEQEIEYLTRRQTEVEDRTLETMAEVEEGGSRLEEGQERLLRVETEWEVTQEDLLRRAADLRSRLDSLGEERERTLLLVSQERQAMYEDLRQQKGGQAVALLEGGLCQGCRVALPTSMIQKVRQGEDLVRCSSCQRILHFAS